jgi:pimeloyl-ACP methyl ester carboxylesterase
LIARLSRKRLNVGELSFAVVDEGQGPAVLLLHGFPDSADLWRNQIPALVAAGYRVVAPDLRGFGESDKPEETDAYRIPNLLGDVVGIMDQLEVGRANVVGHDWGAALAWGLAGFMPERVERLVALSVGHPSTFADRSWEQYQMSWYMLLFQFRGVAEQWLRADDWRGMRVMAGESVDGERYIADLSRPGALEAALAWYRANLPAESWVGPARPFPVITVPTLGAWSSRDRFLTEDQMIRSGDYVEGPWRYERIEDATHWMQLDQPEMINRLLINFLS